MHGTDERSVSKIEFERIVAEVIDPVERGRRREQAEMIGALREQAVDEGGVDAVGREHRVRNALRRILVVVEAGGAEREVEVGDHRIEREVAGDRPADVVGDRRGTDATLGADHRDHAPDRLGLGHREQAADGANHVDGCDRRNDIFADAAAHQLAVKRDIVHPADHDDAGAGITDTGQLVEAGEDVVATIGLEDDHIGRRRIVVGLDGGDHAAHLDLQMRLAEAAILARRLHGGSGFDRLAEGLHGNAWRRRDVLVVRCRLCCRRLGVLVFARVADHFPTSLSLPLSASG